MSVGADKSIEERAREQAEFDERIAREKKMIALRDGKLSFHEAQELIFEECAKGDAIKRAAAEQATREDRERGARLRAGGI
jgi:hypothetical protein